MESEKPRLDQRLLQIDHLTTEAQNPASRDLDCLSPIEIVYLMNEEDSRVAPAVLEVAPAIARAIERIAAAFRAGGRLIYVGAGTSGRLGVLDAAECPPTFGTPPEMIVGIIAGGYGALIRAVEGAEDRPEDAIRDLEQLALTAKDIVCGIATSGRTPYVVAALQHARRRGCFTIGIACNRDAVLVEECDLAIVPVVGPEVLSGSTRLKAGTATKLVLNMLTTGAMVRIGKTYGNLMVDLKATNVKLKLRSTRIVSQLLNIDREAARRLLERCDWEVKTALVAGKRGCSAEEARQLLQHSDGHVRVALGEQPPTPVNVPEGTPLVIGLDGGGTRTRVVLAAAKGADVGPELARLETEGTNPNLYGVHPAARTIVRAVCRIARQCGVSLPVHMLSCCIAGTGDADVRARLECVLQSTGVAQTIVIGTDADAVFAAVDVAVGVCIICGTGSYVEARYADGTRRRSGGWGWAIGDPGSGFDVGRRALLETCRRLDAGRPLTSLDQEVLKAIEASSEAPSRSIRECIYGTNPAETVRTVAKATAAVSAAAAAGDPHALALIEEAAILLADQVRHVAEPFASESKWPLLLAGGALVHSPVLQDILCRVLETQAVGNFSLHVVHDSVVGAVHYGLRATHRGPAQTDPH